MAASLRNKPQQQSNLLFGDSYQKLLPALLAQTVASRRAVHRDYVIGWSDPVCGRELHPLEGSGFHGALFRQLTDYSGSQLNSMSSASIVQLPPVSVILCFKKSVFLSSSVSSIHVLPVGSVVAK